MSGVSRGGRGARGAGGVAGEAPDWAAVAAAIAGSTGVRPRRGELLSRHTTMRVGGPADLLAVARDAGQMAALLRFVRENGVAFTIIGRGSNVIAADEGVRGVVIVSRAEGRRLEGTSLIAEAGLPLATAATVAQQAGLAGLEFGIAIPGTVGGAVWANAGAHGSDVASVLEWARVIRGDGIETTETAASLGLAYRDSSLKRSPGTIVLEASFGLAPALPAAIKARMDDVRRWRREHQPLGSPSAGSVFRNPPGDSAGRLIDACGLKGARVGGAAISVRHANFIVNEGGATARDVRHLAEIAQAEVARKLGVRLEYEVQFIGDWPDGQEEQ